MSSIKGTSGVQSSHDAFSKVDDIVSKPVLGSDGAASWQEFRKDHKSNRASAAPKAPLKKLDKLGAGFSSWEDERAHEDKVRSKAGHASTGSGYTTFKKKNSSEEAAERKRIKQVEARIRPDNKEYFLPAPTFQGWKFDYIFTTRSGRSTGYYWDGTDSIKKMNGELKEPEPSVSASSKEQVDDDNNDPPADDIKPKKKKRKKNAGPTIINDPNNPLEQVAAVLQKRNQKLAGGPLPDGWEASRDPYTGKTYYYCRATGKRSWEKPELPQAESGDHKKEDLAEGWKSALDQGSGKTYYFNNATGETKWEKPPLKPQETNINQAVDKLPDGWSAVQDATTGKTYYYHQTKGETSWDKPTA